MWRFTELALLAFALLATRTAHARAGETLYFSHADERYLKQEQQRGGAAFVPASAQPGDRLPLIVFLHGTNPRGVLHLWFGGLGRDLRPVSERLSKAREVRPFVLAAPSQTTSANGGHSLWSNFDLGQFVADTGTAVGARVTLDVDAVYLFGHSGAGCNPEGGLATNFSGAALKPLAIVSIDPCLDEEMGIAFSSSKIPLWVLWQSQVWERDVDGWSSALLLGRNDGTSYRITHLTAPESSPHDLVVPFAFQKAVRELLKAGPDNADGTQRSSS